MAGPEIDTGLVESCVQGQLIQGQLIRGQLIRGQLFRRSVQAIGTRNEARDLSNNTIRLSADPVMRGARIFLSVDLFLIE